MYDYAVVPIIALICYIFLLVTFIVAKKDAAIKSFMSLLLTMIMWTGGSFLMRLNYFPSLDFWYYVSLAGILFFLPALFSFVKNYLNTTHSYYMHLWFTIIIIVWVINCFYPIFLHAPSFVHTDVINGYVYDFSWPVIVLLLIELGALSEFIRMLFHESRTNHKIIKLLSPILIGLAIMALGNICLFLPLFKGFPIDVFSGIPMAICLFYALYKRHLFQLNLLVSRSNCYIIASFITIFIFYKYIPLYEELLRSLYLFSDVQLTLVISFTVMLFTVSIYIILHTMFDTVFGKTEMIQAETLRVFSTKVSQLMNVQEILKELALLLKKGLNVERVYFFLKNNHNDFELEKPGTAQKHYVIPYDEQLLSLLEEYEGCFLIKDYKLTNDYRNISFLQKKELSQNKIDCIVAIKDDNHYLGLILLPVKSSGEKYNHSDINFLKSINSVASIAIKNSRLYEEAYQEARRDYLTGVANRRCLFEVIESCRTQTRFEYGCLIMVSLDDFKLYNQLYGDEEGNVALHEVAQVIAQVVGDKGLVARYSGKVFAVMLPNHKVEEAKKVAEVFSKKIHELNKSTGENAMKILTVSCGIAFGICRDVDFEALIKQADTALFYAKQAGKNRIEIYTEGHYDEKTDSLAYQKGVYSEYASTVYALTAAIDAKDHYTFSHSENVAYYAQELAKAYGMNEEGIKIVYEAGLLHDIGKIGIDESILNKPDRLTKEEYEIIKRHVELSIGIIRHLPSLDYVIPAVIGHHERYDGKGYPRGIAGDSIPLMARILCIADSFDAMTSKRSYKPKMSVDKAIAILEVEAGHQFDPKLVPIFVKLVQDGKIRVD